MNTLDWPLASDDELRALVEAFVEGTADEAQRARLESRLRLDANARQFYVAYLDLHAQLYCDLRSHSRVERSTPVATLSRPAIRTRVGVPRRYMLAAASLLIALIVAVPVLT